MTRRTENRPPEAPKLSDLARESLKVGFLSFGGPAGQIALMHRIYVDERKWIDEERYMHALNYCMLLPGPEAQQLAVYVGWLVRGVAGGVIAGILFVLPGAALLTGLSWSYAAHAEASALVAAFYGVKAAVIAILAQALAKIGRRALKARSDLFVAILSFAALFVFGAPYPAVIVAAGFAGYVLAPRNPPGALTNLPPADSRGAAAAAAAALFLWLLPLAGVYLLMGEGHVLTQVGLLFSQLAVVTFGGAYAVLAYLQQQAVEAHQWLTAGQMIDGLGLAETTPGPLVLVNQFVAFIAGWNAGGVMLALACAAMASWCTFAPSFLWIYAGAPYAERLRANVRLAGALRAVAAAVLGVVASLALWFAQHVLFRAAIPVKTIWGRVVELPEIASVNTFALTLAAAAAVALIRFKAKLLLVLGACVGAALLSSAVTGL